MCFQGSFCATAKGQWYLLFVTFGTRAAALTAALAVVALLVVAHQHRSSDEAPGTRLGDGRSNTETGGPMLALMTEDRCIYQGSAPPATGTFAVQVENHTVYDGHFLLAKVAAGVTDTAVSSFFRAMRRQPSQGRSGPLHIPAPWMEPVSDTTVGSGAISELPGNSGPGRYIVVCTHGRSPGVPRAVYAVTLPPS